VTYFDTPHSNYERIDCSSDSSVASGGGTETMQLKPDVGFIYTVKRIALYIPDPAGSSANSHKLLCRTGASSTAGVGSVNAVFYLSSNTGSSMKTQYGAFDATSEYPSGATQQHEIIAGETGLMASNDQPIDFVYTNDTDVNQTATKHIYVWVEKVPEMS